MKTQTVSQALMMALVGIVTVAAAARADTLCVNPGGTGGCHSTFQAAVNAAPSRSTINVAAGTYPGGFRIAARKKLTVVGAGAGVTSITPPNLYASLIEIDEHAKLTLSGLSVLNSTGDGIVLAIDGHGQLVLTESVISGSDGAGITSFFGTVSVERSTLSGNGFGSPPIRGGGIGCEGGRCTIANSTISGNHAIDGAGASIVYGSMKILTSTVSGNSASVTPGGVYVFGSRAQVKNSTIAGNSAAYASGCGGIATGNDGKVTMSATVIANNSSPSAFPDCHAPVRSRDFNLVENATGCDFGPSGPKTHDLVGVDPLLGSLASNGGPTQTHALQVGSPARGVVTSASACRPPDQRGVPRARPCDMGAYEAP